jgi:zinc protease
MARSIDFEKKIMALTPDQMLKAIKKHIDPSQLTYVRAGDFQKAGVTW